MTQYVITQTRSAIGTTPKQKLYLKSLGLKKIGSVVIREKTKSVESLLQRLEHLVKFSIKD